MHWYRKRKLDWVLAGSQHSHRQNDDVSDTLASRLDDVSLPYDRERILAALMWLAEVSKRQPNDVVSVPDWSQAQNRLHQRLNDWLMEQLRWQKPESSSHCWLGSLQRQLQPTPVGFLRKPSKPSIRASAPLAGKVHFPGVHFACADAVVHPQSAVVENTSRVVLPKEEGLDNSVHQVAGFVNKGKLTRKSDVPTFSWTY